MGMKQQMKDEEDLMPHMYDGGINDPIDPFSVDTGDSSTVKAMPMNPAAIPPQTTEPAAPMPAPMTTPVPGIAPKPAVVTSPTALTDKAVNPTSLPGMPPGITPDVLKGYLDKQRGQLNKYSPDDQYAIEKDMQNQGNSIQGMLARKLPALGDAIMQGVARAGSGGFAQHEQDLEKQQYDNAVGSMERARAGTRQGVEDQQKLDAMDPNSPLSKTYQQGFAGVLQKMHYDPKSIANMPASQIGTIADLGVKHEDAQTQADLKKAMLQVQAMTAQGTIANQKAERAENERKLELEHPVQGLIKNIFNKLTGDGQGAAAQTGPYGATTTRNGVNYEWSPVTGKYHPKGQ